MVDYAYPPFKLNGYRHDQSTFSGRLRHFLEVIDPRTLLTTQKRLTECIQLLDDYRQGKRTPHVTDRDLWEAQKTKQAIIHPDTGEKIFMPFRMSGYVPFGTPIVVGLLLPGPTLLQTVFWQTLNQSHNALVNYSNRNATKPTPVSRFMLGYVGAVTSAVSIAVGMNVFLDKAKAFSATTKYLMQRFIPYPAVACANVCNVVLMRNNELTSGIDVLDKEGNVVGTSQIAARKAVFQTAATRVFLPAPVLLLPPIIMSLLEKTKIMKLNPRLHLPVSAVVCTLCFGGGLPVAIALFPQMSEIATDELELEIRNRTTEKLLFYNKGL